MAFDIHSNKPFFEKGRAVLWYYPGYLLSGQTLVTFNMVFQILQSQKPSFVDAKLMPYTNLIEDKKVIIFICLALFCPYSKWWMLNIIFVFLYKYFQNQCIRFDEVCDPRILDADLKSSKQRIAFGMNVLLPPYHINSLYDTFFLKPAVGMMRVMFFLYILWWHETKPKREVM